MDETTERDNDRQRVNIDEPADTDRSENRGDAPLDETPGSQGEIEAGSEGDFGRRDEPR